MEIYICHLDFIAFSHLSIDAGIRHRLEVLTWNCRSSIVCKGYRLTLRHEESIDGWRIQLANLLNPFTLWC
jgi:hypothetical protein